MQTIHPLPTSRQPDLPSPKSVVAPILPHPRSATRKRLRHPSSMSSQDRHVQALLATGVDPVSPAISSSSTLPMPHLPEKRSAPSIIHNSSSSNPSVHNANRFLQNTPPVVKDSPKQKKRRNWAPIAIVPMKNIAIPSHLPPSRSLDLKLHYRAMCAMEQEIFGVSTLLSLVKYVLKGSADLKKIAALGRRLSKTRKRFLNVQRGVFDVQNERNECTVIPQKNNSHNTTSRQTTTNNNNSAPNTLVDDIQDVSPGLEQDRSSQLATTTVSQPLQFSSSNRPHHSHTPLELASSEKNHVQGKNKDGDGEDDEVITNETFGPTYGPSAGINANNNGSGGEAHNAHGLTNMQWNTPDCTTSFSPMGIGNTNSISSALRNQFQGPAPLPAQNQSHNTLHHHHQQGNIPIPTLDYNNLAIDTREITASYNHNHQHQRSVSAQRNNARATLEQHSWLPSVAAFDGDHHNHNAVHNVPNITTLQTNMGNVIPNRMAHDAHLASHFPPQEAPDPKVGYPGASSANAAHLSVPVQHTSTACAPAVDMHPHTVPMSNINTYAHGAKNNTNSMVDKIDTAELANTQSQFTLPDFSPVTPIPPHRTNHNANNINSNSNINSLANWEASYTSSMTNAMGASTTTNTTATAPDSGHAQGYHNAVFEGNHYANANGARLIGSGNTQHASMLGQYGHLRELMGLGGGERGGNNLNSTSDIGSFVNQSESAYFSAHN